jgi:hypothetical protein
MLISLIRHIDAKRELVSNYQVGVNLLRGLQYSLMFPIFSHVGVFSSLLLRALARRDETVLRFYGRACHYRVCAANRGLSQEDRITVFGPLSGEQMPRYFVSCYFVLLSFSQLGSKYHADR